MVGSKFVNDATLPPAKLDYQAVVELGTFGSVCDFLAAKTGLPKLRIKDAMNKGAVWVSARGGKHRVRRATTPIKVGDNIEIHYDADVLARVPGIAECLADERDYSVWFKPAGLLAQGSPQGDHCALLRQVELYFQPARPVFLVHRLDREASGIMVVAHTRQASAGLSALFNEGRVVKRYLVGVSGRTQPTGTIDEPLDGKSAKTHYETLSFDAEHNESTLSVRIETGRLHQIRRHFEGIGFPVMGDPKYGRNNSNSEGMRLMAAELEFVCPLSKVPRHYLVPDNNT